MQAFSLALLPDMRPRHESGNGHPAHDYVSLQGMRDGEGVADRNPEAFALNARCA